jgi:hypothetical protein
MGSRDQALHVGIDWGTGASFMGLTITCGGKVIGTVTAISTPEVDYGPDVLVEEIDVTKYVVPRGQESVTTPITKMLVNWPLMTELKRQEIADLLAGREAHELSAEETIQLLELVSTYEDLKGRPNEFADISGEEE